MNIKRDKNGKHLSEEHKKKISRTAKGRIPWNKGKRGVYSKETLKKMSKAKRGGIPWNKGKKAGPPSKKHRRKISKAKMGHFTSQETKKRISETLMGKYCGSKHPLWQGGISFEPYGLKFNNELKRQIRKRDNYVCQECGYTQKQLGYKLDIHHIDYNKKNNNPMNLISLCRSCNTKANFGREDWTKYYQEKVKASYPPMLEEDKKEKPVIRRERE